MKQILLYATTLFASGLLIYLAEQWYGAEWLFGLLTVGVFAAFLQGWKRLGKSGGGLVAVSALLLLAINSIFFVQNLPAFICSLAMGLLLIPHFKSQPDSVSASIVFVVLNMLIAIEFIPNEMMYWLLVVTTGVAAIIGFRLDLLLLKSIFTILFSIAALFLLFLELADGSYMLGAAAVLLIGFLIFSMYRLNGRTAS